MMLKRLGFPGLYSDFGFALYRIYAVFGVGQNKEGSTNERMLVVTG
jgi:hypothetical protein